jgi:type IV pilus assembly protein PilY1
VIYVGANDGMLHGFDARNDATNGGEELLAYIPNLVYSDQSGEGLHYLADPNYSHKYYVDQSPVVQDVYTKGDDSDSSADWRTVLIGGLRGGGKGLFALDVTHPDEFSELDENADKLMMWEFDETNAPDAAGNLGYQLSPPAIAMMNNKQWAVIFGNGAGSVNGRAVLFVVYIEEGLDGTWTVDDDYMMIDTGKGSTLDPNGLSGVAVADTNGDFMADRIYAGDIQGNMWAFDVSSDTPIVPAKGAKPEIRNWAVADSNGDPLFTAEYSYTDPNTATLVTERQPITAAPGLAFNTEQVTSNNLPNILVTFGTGQYLEKDDISDATVQSYYTVWDKSDHALTRTNLTERSLSQTGTKLSLSGGVADPWGSLYGWFFDMAPEVIPENQTSGTVQENGERLINKPLLAPDKDLGPVAIFASMIPDSSECSGGGSSVLYALPLLTGTNPDKAIADLNGDGLINDDDKGVGLSKDDLINDPNRLGQYLYGSKGDSSGVDVTETTINSAGDREGRLGWFELIDE